MKSHFQVLDGLRGAAALSVFLFHICELFAPDLARNPMPHTFLAVDFFFALSGFVLGHAYDARLDARPTRQAGVQPRLSIKGFIMRRLIRLHPMVVVAMITGIAGYLLDPHAGNTQRIGEQLSLGLLLVTFGLSLLLLPTPPLPNTFGETHSVNGPSWTLFQEYIANALYVLFAPHLGRKMHVTLCVISALALLRTANHFGNLGSGLDWQRFWVAPVRLACPFLLGLLVHRMRLRIPLPQPYLVLSLALCAIFVAPVMGRLNGLFEAACVVLVFPLVLMAGAGSTQVGGVTDRVCRFAGELSYPVYIIHYPFIYLFAHWVWSKHPALPLLVIAIVMLCVAVILFAYALSRWYDRPVRAWLTRVYLEHEARSLRGSTFLASSGQ